MKKIILASQSPRRKQLLEWAEIEFEVIVRPTDESYPPELSTIEIPVHIAMEKARRVQQETGNEHVILAADTVVVLDELIIGKPKDRAGAIQILQSLANRKHEVITGVVILAGEEIIKFADKTTVSFHPLSVSEIEFYVDKYQPYDKAGGYAIQEWIGVTGIKEIIGDFYNVMGLPISRVVQELKKL